MYINVWKYALTVKHPAKSGILQISSSSRHFHQWILGWKGRIYETWSLPLHKGMSHFSLSFRFISNNNESNKYILKYIYTYMNCHQTLNYMAKISFISFYPSFLLDLCDNMFRINYEYLYDCVFKSTYKMIICN